MTLRVYEIFRSVQGESTWAGRPCVFVRLAGCPLRCSYCDTAYAREAEGLAMTVAEIVAEALALDCPLVELTGGEPLAQEECPALARALLDAGLTVLVETGGALPIDRLPAEAIRIVDFKCPGSGEAEGNDWGNVERLGPRDEVKFVVGDRADFDWAAEAVRRHNLPERCHAVLLAPAFGALEPRQLAEWLLESGLDARLQLQQHKYIWPPDARGI